jgi:hypothetical protein
MAGHSDQEAMRAAKIFASWARDQLARCGERGRGIGPQTPGRVQINKAMIGCAPAFFEVAVDLRGLDAFARCCACATRPAFVVGPKGLYSLYPDRRHFSSRLTQAGDMPTAAAISRCVALCSSWASPMSSAASCRDFSPASIASFARPNNSAFVVLFVAVDGISSSAAWESNIGCLLLRGSRRLDVLGHAPTEAPDDTVARGYRRFRRARPFRARGLDRHGQPQNWRLSSAAMVVSSMRS